MSNSKHNRRRNFCNPAYIGAVYNTCGHQYTIKHQQYGPENIEYYDNFDPYYTLTNYRPAYEWYDQWYDWFWHKKDVLVKKNVAYPPNSIKFDGDQDNPFYILTNFYTGAPFMINNITFQTPEHFYQWSKFIDLVVKNRILTAPTARMATQIAEQSKYLVIPNFDRNKNNVMLAALRAKFSQNPTVGEALKDTNNRLLIEHSVYDKYWTDGGDGTGMNVMGILLMLVRRELLDNKLTYAAPFKG